MRAVYAVMAIIAITVVCVIDEPLIPAEANPHPTRSADSCLIQPSTPPGG
jgi:hypothetical protein